MVKFINTKVKTETNEIPMWILSKEKLKDREPHGYCFKTGFYIYRVHRDKNKIYHERLFENINELMRVLIKLQRKDLKCQ